MSELITGGVNLMIMGMGTVFVFLTVLVIGTTLMSQLIMRMPSTAAAEVSKKPAQRSAKPSNDLAIVAAVAAAAKTAHNA